MPTRLATALSTLIVLMTSGAAHAQAIRAAAMPPVFKNNTGSPELQAKFQDLVVQGLVGLNGPSGPNGELGDVLSAGQTRDQLGELQSCGNEVSCLPRATHALGVNRLFTTEVTVAGKSYTIAMRVYDGDARELSQTTELCDICTLHEAEALVTKTAQKLATVARSFPVEEVTPPKPPEKPPEPVKPPPVEPKPKPAEPLQPQPTPEELQPMTSPPSPLEAPSPPPSPKRHVPWRILGFSAVGLGVVGFAVGIPLLVIDGRPTCGSADPTHTCPHVYNTRGGGIAMTVIGALSLAASVPLFYLDYKDRHAKKALAFGAMPTWGGAAATIGGRF